MPVFYTTKSVADAWILTEVLAPLRALLLEWPPVFPSKKGDPVRPLARGIRDDLLRLLPADNPDAIGVLDTTLRRYVRSTHSEGSMALPGAQRLALEGPPVDPLE